MNLGGEAACFCEMIGYLLFLQAVGVDGLSTVCPVEINRFIPHQARLCEKGDTMRAESGNLLNLLKQTLNFHHNYKCKQQPFTRSSPRLLHITSASW